MLDKTYDFGAVEERIYRLWEQTGAFASGRKPAAQPFTIVIPPPNVTGSLHMGHALNTTLQDILIRFERMRGRDVLWQPGTDHAGIATQMVVERQLAEEGLTRHDLGREAFIERVWQWKAESGNTISKQLRRLGASCDWERERFTMDEGFSRAVLTVFVDLYKKGLIYRDKRLVNWDCKLHTAISDLEVEQREIKGHLWHIRYPVKGREGTFITVATTRPETMLGDTGIAVHPEDPRYRDLIGAYAVLPLVGRELPIVGDEHADPEQGSGAVKITPAHDFNDFAVGQRHNLEAINIFDQDACLNDCVPEKYRGLNRYDAREVVVQDLEAAEALVQVDEHVHSVPYGDRSGVVIEPLLTDQWYVDAVKLAEPAIKAVEEGDTRFVPEQWGRTYFEWMRNIQPWCISRQLWWGHRIPAWYGPDGDIFVALTEQEAQGEANAKYGREVSLRRDTDVLDTWFSSQLWPFATLGWPDATPELARYYKTDVLVTAFDIIFFWVARMMMAGLAFMKDEQGRPEVPFHTVYIHALVRDDEGQKMSKSKGNVIDPLDLIERYGADSLRFTLAAMAAQGRDIKLSESRIAGYRNFGTKLWNAARFCEMNGCKIPVDFDPDTCISPLNRWIVGAARSATQEVVRALEEFRFNDAAGAIYQFTWHTFCDWYLEFIKPLLYGEDEAAKAETRAVAMWVLEQILKLLHPFMPFITEELWSKLGTDRASQLILADWPETEGAEVHTEGAREMEWTINIISEIRTARAELNVPAGAIVPAYIRADGTPAGDWLSSQQSLIERLARVKLGAPPDAGGDGEQSVVIACEAATLYLQLYGIIDFDLERARLEKEIGKLTGEVKALDGRLSNQNFLAKAPAKVIEDNRAKRTEAEQALARIRAALQRLFPAQKVH